MRLNRRPASVRSIRRLSERREQVSCKIFLPANFVEEIPWTDVIFCKLRALSPAFLCLRVRGSCWPRMQGGGHSKLRRKSRAETFRHDARLDSGGPDPQDSVSEDARKHHPLQKPPLPRCLRIALPGWASSPRNSGRGRSPFSQSLVRWRLDSLDPAAFKYEVTAREITTPRG